MNDPYAEIRGAITKMHEREEARLEAAAEARVLTSLEEIKQLIDRPEPLITDRENREYLWSPRQNEYTATRELAPISVADWDSFLEVTETLLDAHSVHPITEKIAVSVSGTQTTATVANRYSVILTDTVPTAIAVFRNLQGSWYEHADFYEALLGLSPWIPDKSSIAAFERIASSAEIEEVSSVIFDEAGGSEDSRVARFRIGPKEYESALPRVIFVSITPSHELESIIYEIPVDVTRRDGSILFRIRGAGALDLASERLRALAVGRLEGARKRFETYENVAVYLAP